MELESQVTRETGPRATREKATATCKEKGKNRVKEGRYLYAFGGASFLTGAQGARVQKCPDWENARYLKHGVCICNQGGAGPCMALHAGSFESAFVLISLRLSVNLMSTYLSLSPSLSFRGSMINTDAKGLPGAVLKRHPN